ESVGLEFGVARERWGGAFAQIGKDHAEVFLGGIARYSHLGREAGVLGRLLDALARAVVFPAVVEAAQAVALHPAGRELRAPVRAARRHDVRCAALAAVEGEVLAHGADGLRLARREVAGQRHRLPETAQVAPGERAGPGVRPIGVVGRGVA